MVGRALLKQLTVPTLLAFLVGASLCAVDAAHAHPVSFKGGYGVMPNYSPERKDIELNYSFESDQSFGVNLIRMDYESEDLSFVIPQYSYKVYRDNRPGSQTNLYATVGLGGARYLEENRVAGAASFQADYETRRFYTLLFGEHLQAEDGISLNRVRYRLGIAPYLAPFDGFHTWIIGQVELTPELEHEWTFTPMLRFFVDTYLLEIGASTRGEMFIAGIFHF